jgi:hypothetical protein
MSIEKSFLIEKARQAVLDDEFNTCMHNPDYLVNLIAELWDNAPDDYMLKEAQNRGLDIGEYDE